LRLTTVATATGYISLAVLAGLDFTCNLTAAILGFQVLQAGPS